MGTGSGHTSKNAGNSNAWPVPVPIFSQTLSSCTTISMSRRSRSGIVFCKVTVHNPGTWPRRSLVLLDLGAFESHVAGGLGIDLPGTGHFDVLALDEDVPVIFQG